MPALLHPIPSSTDSLPLNERVVDAGSQMNTSIDSARVGTHPLSAVNAVSGAVGEAGALAAVPNGVVDGEVQRRDAYLGLHSSGDIVVRALLFLGSID